MLIRNQDKDLSSKLDKNYEQLDKRLSDQADQIVI